MSEGLIVGQIVGSELVQAKLAQIGAMQRKRISATVHRLGLMTLKAAKEYLNGPRPENLGDVSGRLRRSVNENFTEDGNTFRSTVGTNLPYGAYWEKGFDRKVGFGARGGPKTALSQYGEQRAIIRSYTKYGNSPGMTKHFDARPFLTPALADMKDEIRARLASAMGGS
jgi:phage gpG-like protein